MRRGTVALALALILATAGCETVRWRSHSPDEIFARERIPDRVRLVTGADSAHVLEGVRTETDSVIGFEEVEDGDWRRIAAPAGAATLQLWERDWGRTFLFGILPQAAYLVLSTAGG